MAEKLLTIFFEEFSKFGLVHFVISLLKNGRIFKIKILDPQFFFFSCNLHQFSSIGGLRATIADFGTRGPVFKSRLHLLIFLMKMLMSMGFEPGVFNSEVSYDYPYTTETEVLMQKKISDVIFLDVR